MREIVLDTETTGLDPMNGDRVVEIGAIELINSIPTGHSYHQYINPGRSMPPDAFRVHGLSDEFLRDKPPFADIADAFVAFWAGDRLIAHNASFDVAFLNSELDRCGHRPSAPDVVVDTLAIARRKHAGAPASLDALCARYGIDNSRRTRHGALLDAELLAEVYLELTGGRQSALGLEFAGRDHEPHAAGGPRPARRRPEPLAPRLTEAEIAANAAFVATLGGGAVWLQYETFRTATAAADRVEAAE
jgi:DNA polymerase-3 subunit epsilon